MPTSEQLLAAISAHPDDDAPRLAYAEMVERAEPEYAEFCRLQIARTARERAARAPRGAADPRERLLLRRHGLQWAHYIEKFVRESPRDSDDLGWGFERGHIAFMRMEPENFLALGERLFAMAPVEHVELTGGEERVAPLFASHLLSRLHSLSLRGAGLDDEDAIALAACGPLAGCAWLDLGDNHIGRRGIEALAASPVMASKVVVRLDGNPCFPSDVPQFAPTNGIVDAIDVSPIADDIEARLGRRVSWFHFNWATAADVPDRYHARWAVSGA